MRQSKPSTLTSIIHKIQAIVPGAVFFERVWEGEALFRVQAADRSAAHGLTREEAARNLFEMLDREMDDGTFGATCLLCDGVGHGYPGAGPCPLEDHPDPADYQLPTLNF